MKIECYPVEKIKKEIQQIITKYLDLRNYKIFFFGSRVKGNNFPRADIDIGIEGSEELPVKIKLDIEEELDKLPTLYKIDFVDFKNVSDDFRIATLKYREYL
ncbi:MAG: nucleotidyltransferase domain-containing protein [Elusimicrobia bacterium CG06_land_8_20_14_3_00_38_11]|nr:MAG: nucleotidyltransferase domain-containing protein [Elusimicrobia bacterium CG06_land_8_20_14_3_00_38_11]